MLGSWIIKYEKIDHPIIGENTIVSSAQEGDASEEQKPVDTDEVPAESSAVTEEGTAVPEPSQTEVEDIGKETENAGDNSTENIAEDAKKQSPLEVVDSKIVAFKDYFGKPSVSAYIAIKNNTDYCIGINNPKMDYQDNDGKLLATDPFANCIPEVAKPGQVFYLYSYHFSIADVDISNGLNYSPGGKTFEAKNYYEVDISDQRHRS